MSCIEVAQLHGVLPADLRASISEQLARVDAMLVRHGPPPRRLQRLPRRRAHEAADADRAMDCDHDREACLALAKAAVTTRAAAATSGAPLTHG